MSGHGEPGILSSQKGGNRDAFSSQVPSDLPAHFPKVVGAALAGHVLGGQHSPQAAACTSPFPQFPPCFLALLQSGRRRGQSPFQDLGQMDRALQMDPGPRAAGPTFMWGGGSPVSSLPAPPTWAGRTPPLCGSYSFHFLVFLYLLFTLNCLYSNNKPHTYSCFLCLT